MFSLKQVSKHEAVPFDLGNGQIITFRQYRDFTIAEISTWERVRRTGANLSKQREQATTQDKHENLTKTSQAACREMVKLALPEFPVEMLNELSAGQLDGLAAICIQVISGTHQAGRPDAAEIEKLMTLHPSLPLEFWETVNRRQAAILLGTDRGNE